MPEPMGGTKLKIVFGKKNSEEMPAEEPMEMPILQEIGEALKMGDKNAAKALIDSYETEEIETPKPAMGMQDQMMEKFN